MVKKKKTIISCNSAISVWCLPLEVEQWIAHRPSSWQSKCVGRFWKKVEGPLTSMLLGQHIVTWTQSHGRWIHISNLNQLLWENAVVLLWIPTENLIILLTPHFWANSSCKVMTTLWPQMRVGTRSKLKAGGCLWPHENTLKLWWLQTTHLTETISDLETVPVWTRSHSLDRIEYIPEALTSLQMLSKKMTNCPVITKWRIFECEWFLLVDWGAAAHMGWGTTQVACWARQTGPGPGLQMGYRAATDLQGWGVLPDTTVLSSHILEAFKQKERLFLSEQHTSFFKHVFDDYFSITQCWVIQKNTDLRILTVF